MSSRTTRSQTRKAPGGAGASTEPPPEATSKRPAKRAKTIKDAKKPTPAKNARKKGRLSVLPTLPLDVLFETFAHLGPADLLHLSRTTKAFRNVLLTRQASFLWKTVFDSMDETEKFPCPEDVSLPVWINLVYGGPWCDGPDCSARANKVLWNLRRRLCKRCTGEVLVDTSGVFDIFGDKCIWIDFMLDPQDIFPGDYTTRGHSNRLVLLYSTKDVQDYADEIEELLENHRPKLTDAQDKTGFTKAMSDLNESKKAKLTVRKEHARICDERELVRTDMRSDELWRMKKDRFLDVKQRLMALGVAEEDAGSPDIEGHKEVNKPQTLTDRVWTRIGPILRAEADRLRDERLARERLNRLNTRRRAVRIEYERRHLLRVAPSMLCYVPKVSIIFKLPIVAEFLAEDIELEDPADLPPILTIRSTLNEEVPATIDGWIMRRQNTLRNTLPELWPRASFAEEEIATHWPPPTDPASYNRYANIADLDLAVYAFQCSATGCHERGRIFYGLDILAHDCLNQDVSKYTHFADGKPINYSLHAQPVPTLHLGATRVVELLGMDPTKTRPVDLDKADRLFTAEPFRPHDRGQPFMTWRQAVAYCAAADTGVAWAQPAALRLATEREKVYVETRHRALHGTLPLHDPEDLMWWGCAHCSFLNDVGVSHPEWLTLDEVKEHLEDLHDLEVDAAKEGDDYFFNRMRDRDHDVNDDGALAYLEDDVDIEEVIRLYDVIGDNFMPGSDLSDDDGDGPVNFFAGLPFPFPGMFWNDDGDDGFDSDGF